MCFSVVSLSTLFFIFRWASIVATPCESYLVFAPTWLFCFCVSVGPVFCAYLHQLLPGLYDLSSFLLLSFACFACPMTRGLGGCGNLVSRLYDKQGSTSVLRNTA